MFIFVNILRFFGFSLPLVIFLKNNFSKRLAKSSQIATIDRPYKFKNKPTKLSIYMRNVHDFSDFFFELRAPWIKPRRMHPTFMRGNLIVSEIEIQVASDPELNPGNHIEVLNVKVHVF